MPIDSILAEGVKICNKFYVPEICQGAVDMFKVLTKVNPIYFLLVFVDDSHFVNSLLTKLKKLKFFQ